MLIFKLTMETLFYGTLTFMLIVIIALMRRNLALSRSYDSVVSEEKVRVEDVLALSKFVSIASELAQLRNAGLKDRKYFFETVLDSACVILNSGRGSIMVYDELRDELSIIAARNINRKLVENTHIRSGEGIAGKAFQSGEIIYVSDPSSNPQYSGFENLPEQKDPFLCLPVKTSRRTYCVINLHLTSSRNHFSDLDLKLLTILADEAGMIMENDRLKKALNPKTKENKKPSAFEESPDAVDAREKREAEERKQRLEQASRKKPQPAAAPSVSRRGFAGGGFGAAAHHSEGGGFAAKPAIRSMADIASAAQAENPSFAGAAAMQGMAGQPSMPGMVPGMAMPNAVPAAAYMQPQEQFMATPQMVYVPVQMPGQPAAPATPVFAQIPAQGGVQYIRIMPQGQYAAVPAGMPTGAEIPPGMTAPAQPQHVQNSQNVPPPPQQNVGVQPMQYVVHPMPNVPVTAAGLAAGNIAPDNVEQATEHLMQRFRLNRGSAAAPQRPPQKPSKTPAPPKSSGKEKDDEVIIDDGQK